MDQVLFLLIDFCTPDEMILFETGWDNFGVLDEDYIKENIDAERGREIASYLYRKRNFLSEGEEEDKGAELYSALLVNYIIKNKIVVEDMRDIEKLIIKE